MACSQPDAAATSTLLLEAAELGDLAAVQRALADGASASVSTRHNTGALALAASKGHLPEDGVRSTPTPLSHSSAFLVSERRALHLHAHL